MTGPRSERRAASRADRFARAFDDKSAGLDRFGLVLAMTSLSVIVLALVDIDGDVHTTTQDVGAIASAVLVGLTLVTALRASGLSRRRQLFIDAGVLMVVLSYAITLLGDKTAEGQANPAVFTLLVVLSCIAPVVIVLRLVRHREITIATVMGSVAAYLLIAVAFFYLFRTVGGHEADFFATAQRQPSSSYMYFSLTTITTVGYGDLTAAHKLGRLLANSEAVIGQVYLVVVVAFIVSLGASAWKSRRDAVFQAAQDADGTVDSGD